MWKVMHSKRGITVCKHRKSSRWPWDLGHGQPLHPRDHPIHHTLNHPVLYHIALATLNMLAQPTQRRELLLTCSQRAPVDLGLVLGTREMLIEC